MSLAKSIVIKNQFFNKNNQAYGSTPAKFVENYMARNDATLTVYPVLKNHALQSSVNAHSIYQNQKRKLLFERESFAKNQPTAKKWFNLTTLEGRSFNQEALSLSKNDLKKQSQLLDQAFQAGHTIHKLVFSYDNQYLIKQNVEKPNINNLSFHENVDELKLRLATQKGCKALANSLGYTKPLFLGSIQLDRDHPHAHIVLCETASAKSSHSKRFKDGSEYGRLNIANRDETRRAIDNSLTISRSIAFMPSNNLEQAQKTNEIYSKHYANLKQDKQVMMIKSLPHEDLVSKKIANSLYHSIASRTHNSPQNVKNKLSDELSSSSSNSFKTANMPPLIYLQLLVLKRRRNRKKYAHYLYRQKENQKQKLKASKQTDRLLNHYQDFQRYKRNNPLYQTMINKKVIPYYRVALKNSSLRYELTQNKSFTPIKTIPQYAKDEHELFNQSLKKSASSLNKRSIHLALSKQLWLWQKKGLITAKEFAKNLDNNDYLPKLKEYSKLPKKEIPSKINLRKRNQNEIDLAKDALHQSKYLPNNKLTHDLVSDCQNSIQSKKLATMQDTLPLVEKSNNDISYKSLSYQEANNLIVHGLNS